ncbi:hypothetical protein Q4516_03715, partial [Mesomycoplasma ovipneumoniae]|uniref:hypothetical protein n=1 Tax=Mesomycoplasma ovipneumoniae TaxID=29562 RepID=UPI0026E1C734
TGIFAYLYSLKSEFFPSNWQTREKIKKAKNSKLLIKDLEFFKRYNKKISQDNFYLFEPQSKTVR